MQRPTSPIDRLIDQATGVRPEEYDDAPGRPRVRTKPLTGRALVETLQVGTKVGTRIEGQCIGCRFLQETEGAPATRCERCPPEPKTVTVARFTPTGLVVMDDGSVFRRNGYKRGETGREGWRTVLTLHSVETPLTVRMPAPMADIDALAWEPMRQQIRVPDSGVWVIVELRERAALPFRFEVRDVLFFRRVAGGSASTAPKARSAGLREAFRYLEALRSDPQLPERLPWLE